MSNESLDILRTGVALMHMSEFFADMGKGKDWVGNPRAVPIAREFSLLLNPRILDIVKAKKVLSHNCYNVATVIERAAKSPSSKNDSEIARDILESLLKS